MDNLSTTHAQGQLREDVADLYFTRNGYAKLNGKCGGDNCFDGVYIKGDQVVINEVKPLQGNQSVKLNPGNEATQLSAQMSDDWVEESIRKLGQSKEPDTIKSYQILKYAYESRNITKIVTGMNDGRMVIIRIKD